jgi:hypothetical protein
MHARLSAYPRCKLWVCTSDLEEIQRVGGERSPILAASLA